MKGSSNSARIIQLLHDAIKGPDAWSLKMQQSHSRAIVVFLLIFVGVCNIDPKF